MDTTTTETHMALETAMTTTDTENTAVADSGERSNPQIGNRERFALRTDGTDWTNRDDPHPDPSSLLRTGSPRCLCNLGCRHVFSSENAYDRHIVMLDNGDARCRTPAELRGFAKRPMARDVAGVWYTPVPVDDEQGQPR